MGEARGDLDVEEISANDPFTREALCARSVNPELRQRRSTVGLQCSCNVLVNFKRLNYLGQPAVTRALQLTGTY
jgi:hypothetical protein